MSIYLNFLIYVLHQKLIVQDTYLIFSNVFLMIHMILIIIYLIQKLLILILNKLLNLYFLLFTGTFSHNRYNLISKPFLNFFLPVSN